MFDELCRFTGKVRIKTHEYHDGKRLFIEHPCRYFSKQSSFRDNNNQIQVENVYYLKDLGAIKLQPNDKLLDADGVEFDIKSSQRIDNIFEDIHEFYKITVG